MPEVAVAVLEFLVLVPMGQVGLVCMIYGDHLVEVEVAVLMAQQVKAVLVTSFGRALIRAVLVVFMAVAVAVQIIALKV